MKLFLDTANLAEITEINGWGVLDGVTTNPTLAGKEKRAFADIIREICDEVGGDVSAEVVATDTDGMLREATELAAIADNVVIKLPLTPAGLSACRQLTDRGVKTNVTLCFSAPQAILAAQAGATYVSPFAGRLDDIANDGIALIAEIADIFRIQGYRTEVLAASLRSPQHVAQAAAVGANVATLPAKVFHQMVKHPLTDAGLERFLADWEVYQASLEA
ncbi:fructose-6-phosphate aldolase [Nitriliruptor alkaliphilus]|uniref:fructose-6-phosphate aldolase n=1 Tax=Nitriliruptor alkaliphilus TaxID=427918 RepID=UPI0006980BF5|nr:fructose-6-phosphate aldolase [Nitriliruptor alkaliphilus]